MCPKEALVQQVWEVFCDNVRCKDGPYTKALDQTDYGMCVARYDFFFAGIDLGLHYEAFLIILPTGALSRFG